MISRILFSISIFFFSFNSLAIAQSDLKTGEFILKATPSQLLGAEAANYKSIIKEDAIITWEIYVPKNYDANRPSGVMVYAGAPQNVRAPTGWFSVLEDNNIIWVAARKSGNGSSIHQRELLAMMSVPLIKNIYNIDQNRIYITGEGRIAGVVAMDYPKVFKGAILSGKLIWSDHAENKVDGIKDNRFVFVTAEKSAFPQGTRLAYNKFRNANIKNVKLMFIANGHSYSRPKFAQSIEYLDNVR